MAINTIPQQEKQQVASFPLRIWAERLIWLAWVPLVLFTIFFASIPDVHNGMHPLRHSTTVVQCH